MRIAHVTHLLSARGGGLAPSALDLAGAQRHEGIDAEVFGVTDPHAAPLVDGPFVRTFDPVGPLSFGWAPRMLDALLSRGPDVVHQHGIFTAVSEFVRRWQRRSSRPVVLAPHGSLEPWPLRRSRWKKFLFKLLIEHDNLARAACLHALTVQEAQNLRRLGFRHPIAIVPNGVSPEAFAPLNGTAPFEVLYPEARNRRILLFMGRLHPKKGLLNLLQAWSSLAQVRRREDWLLVIAGPDERGHLAGLRERVGSLSLEDDVLFTGMVLGERKRAALHAADIAVLPSFSEGFSVSVLEAMAAGAPVVLTDACNFDLESVGAGLVCHPETGSIAERLKEMMSASESARQAMGGRGRDLVAAQYTTSRAATELEHVYTWLTGQGGRPDYVEPASDEKTRS